MLQARNEYVARMGGWIFIISGLGHVSTVPRKTKPEEPTGRCNEQIHGIVYTKSCAAPPRIFLNAAIFIIPPAAYGLCKPAWKLRLSLVKAQIVPILEQERSNIAGYRLSGWFPSTWNDSRRVTSHIITYKMFAIAP